VGWCDNNGAPPHNYYQEKESDMSKGIYIKNRTPNTIAYTTRDGGFSVSIRPLGETGDTQYIPEKYVDEAGIRRLVIKKICSVVTGKDAVESDVRQYTEAESARKERRDAVLKEVDKSHEEELLRVQCHGVTGSGSRCQRTVAVKIRDTKDGESIEPVYCRQHKPAE
jgi:hypothetical protein